MLDYRRRNAEWRRVMAQAAQGAPFHWELRYYPKALYKMLRAILTGPVPADVWRSRMSICLRCPVLDRQTMACRHELPDGVILGCSCYTVYLALTAAPYPRGCYARNITDNEGWPSYEYPTRWAKARAVWRFLFP